MIAVLFASGLFIKYIFFDKSETFSPSSPLTSTLQKPNFPADSRQFIPSCPFKFPEATKSLIARRCVSSLSINSSPPPTAAARIAKKGTLIDNGIMVGNGTSTLPPGTGGLEVASQIVSGGGMARNKFSGPMKMMGRTSGGGTHVNLPLNPAKEMVTIGVQTDLTTPIEDDIVFTVGGSVRKDSVASSSHSSASDAEQQPGSPPPTLEKPRSLDLCVLILNADVSRYRVIQSDT